MFSLPLSLQDRSIQPEFQDRQTHASCVQRVGQQTSLALESSDIQPALQKGPQSPGPGPAPTTVPSALVLRGGEREKATLQLAPLPSGWSSSIPNPSGSWDFREQGGEPR